jgi:UDP-4-amino-4,6-dideoxy-N-acetyl-beta-L-altrosamine N-acetyltransferase
MLTQHEISADEHARWFTQASLDPHQHLLIFEWQGQALGFVSLRELASGGVAEWGFYAAPDAPKGSGRLLGQAALTYAFGQLNLHKVCGQALAFNQRSIGFHLALGFAQEGILRDQHFDGSDHHAIICFGLLATEWQANF